MLRRDAHSMLHLHYRRRLYLLFRGELAFMKYDTGSTRTIWDMPILGKLKKGPRLNTVNKGNITYVYMIRIYNRANIGALSSFIDVIIK